jgi:hypothetical protein
MARLKGVLKFNLSPGQVKEAHTAVRFRECHSQQDRRDCRNGAERLDIENVGFTRYNLLPSFNSIRKFCVLQQLIQGLL